MVDCVYECGSVGVCEREREYVDGRVCGSVYEAACGCGYGSVCGWLAMCVGVCVWEYVDGSVSGSVCVCVWLAMCLWQCVCASMSERV